MEFEAAVTQYDGAPRLEHQTTTRFRLAASSQSQLANIHREQTAFHPFGPRRTDPQATLLPTYSLTLQQPRPAQDVAHRVVAFVTGVLVELVVGLRPR